MNPIDDRNQFLSRRNFLSLASTSLGATALNTLLSQDLYAQNPKVFGGLPSLPHFAPKAKRVIYLFQSGGPSQHELFD
ncbi:MAG: sulfatase, partial [Pseudomonadota bacterium]|nr:sulfatase [Pseudomonadota bacterium]